MKNLYLSLTLLLTASGYSQGENDNWYFGKMVAVNFSSTPTALFDSQMDQYEGSASISDASGKLLFYTNGITIWNREDTTMLNGTGLTGSSTTEQILIVPFPGTNLYYVFTMSYFGSATCNIKYSIVDMSLGSLGTDGFPLGGILPNYKNINMVDDSGVPFTVNTEAITCTPLDDNSGYWILIPNDTELYSYRLDYGGLNPIPVTSTLPTSFNYYQQIKISPNLSPSLGFAYSNYVSMTRWLTTVNDDVWAVSFDNTTGQLVSDYVLHIANTDAYATEFSSNGLLLYMIQTTGAVSVFDLTDPTITGYRAITNGPNMRGGSVQRATNSHIYVAFDGYDHLSEITNPNSFSLSALLLNSIDLNDTHTTHECTLGLPQYVPILPTDQCLSNLILSNPEIHNTFTYEVSGSITTNSGYLTTSSNQEIILSAATTVLMAPNTYIKSESDFLAKIEGCSSSSAKGIRNQAEKNFTRSFVDVALIKKSLIAYPNPAADQMTVSVENEKIQKITLLSIDGKIMISKTIESSDQYELNLTTIPKGVYLLSVETVNGEIHREKIIKK